MLRFAAAALLLVISHPIWGATPPVVCPAGAPIGSVDLRVRRTTGDTPLPLKTINRLEEGETLLYRPVLHSNEKRKGEVSMVLVAANRRPDGENLYVLEPKRADQDAEWSVPARASVAAFVYGPAGLNRKKVERFLSKDDELVAQLADYAEKTAQTEALLQALSPNDASAESVNAAFKGFASQYGPITQLDHTASTEQQAVALFRSLNPAVATYDPIAPEASQRIGQTAGLATSVAALFFGSPVGLAAGGTAMLMELRSIAFPNTAFRSSLAQSLPGDTMALCGRRDAVPAHTKVAYLWATRVPNVGPPRIAFKRVLALPEKGKAPVPVETSDADWKNIGRARKWTLEGSGQKFSVPVQSSGEARALEVDLTKANIPPGDYQLGAEWDWDRFTINGPVRIARLSDFAKARLSAESQDRLIEKTGRTPLTIEGSNFEFVTKAELLKPGDKFFTSVPVPFVLSQGFRSGEQTQMDIQINTTDLDAGDYRLHLTQTDGNPHSVPLAIFPAPPEILNLPVVVHQGDTGPREFTLEGRRLQLIAKIEATGARFTLEPATTNGTKRKLTVQLAFPAPSERSLDVRAYAENRSQPLLLNQAIKIDGPRPLITDAKISLPPAGEVALKAGEIPSGFALSVLLRVSHLEPNAGVSLACAGTDVVSRNLRADSKSDTGTVAQLASDELFLTFDNSGFPNSCKLTATVTDRAGVSLSNAYELGRVVRVPMIETAAFSPSGSEANALLSRECSAELIGRDLETIEEVGWDAEHGTSVTDLPMPIGGDRQQLHIRLPNAPATADAPLYVWLRGETVGRATKARLGQPQRAAAAHRFDSH